MRQTQTGMRVPGLSGVIITYNEEARLAECLDSIFDLCSEILILDSGSTDGTPQVAARYDSVRFVTHAFDGFSRQKNRALSLAQGPWLLCLDADERISPDLAAAVRRFLDPAGGQSIPAELLGAKFTRLTYHLGAPIKHGGWKHFRYRLVRKNAVEWRGVQGLELHELLYPMGKNWSRRSGTPLGGTIYHYSQTDLSQQVNTINTYSSSYAYQRFRRGKSAYFGRMLLKPLVKFCEIYFFKLGILDGVRGLIIAVSGAYSTFLRWAKIYELARTGLPAPSNLPAYLADESTAATTNGAPQ